MASYGLEAVNEPPLEEAASQLSLDSLRGHKNAPYSLNFSRMRCICQEFICLTTSSLWKVDDVSASSFSLAYRRYYLQYNDCSKVLLYINVPYERPIDQSFEMRKTDKP